MTPAALAIVLLAAFIHAIWNLAAKRARSSGVAFVWNCATLSALIWAIPALWLQGDRLAALAPLVWLLAAFSALLHVFYFIALRRAYGLADLSVVYPVARGTGPFLTAVTAVLVLGEPFGILAAIGLSLIVFGGVTIGGGLQAILARRQSPAVRAGLAWGVLTGCLIAAYTINDGFAVRYQGAPALLFDWLAICLRVLILTPFAITQRATVIEALRTDWRPILVVALLSPAAYILVLYAMTLAPVSLVAPAREVSMLFAALLGASLLREGHLVRRLAGAALIALGVAALAWPH